MTDQPTDLTPPTVVTSEPDYTVWVESGRTDQGTYFVGFRCGDAAWAMGRTDAQLYAIGLLQLAQRAEFDSAVMRLFVSHLGMDIDTAGEFLARDVRAGRQPVKVHDSCRLGFLVGVSHRGFKPFLTVMLDGTVIGQWELSGARDHALHVIETCEVVELDAALARVLVEDIELDEAKASAVVNDLARWRWKPGDSEDVVVDPYALAEAVAGTGLPPEPERG